MKIIGAILLVVTGLYFGVMVLSFKYFVFPWYLLPIMAGGLVLAVGGVKLAIWVDRVITGGKDGD